MLMIEIRDITRILDRIYHLGETVLGFLTIILHTPLFILLNWCIAMEAYCVKCKSKRSMKDEKKVTMKNGRPATQGICSVCGTKMFKIGK
jgi:hypothetical protein